MALQKPNGGSDSYSKLMALAGALAVVFFFYFLFNSNDTGFQRILNAALASGGLIFLLWLVFSIVKLILTPIYESIVSSEYAGSTNPFMRGVQGALVTFMILGFLDSVLLQGTFFLNPLLFLLIYGNLEGTIYSCWDVWLFYSEGYGQCGDGDEF